MTFDIEIPLNRVVDRTESVDDWRALEAAREARPQLPHELWDALRLDATLRAELEEVVGAVRPAELPASTQRRSRRPGLSGWFVAAALAVAWVCTSVGQAPAHNAEGVGESDGQSLAPVVLQARPVQGGVEMLVLRRSLERRVVPELYRLTPDEHGVPVSAPVDLASYTQPVRY